jgi:hypothetical protein
MLEDFERFTKQGKTFLPKVSIRKRGSIGFNTGCISKFGLEKYDYAVMYISKNRDRIAIKFTNNEKEAGAVRVMKRQGNFSFSGKSFFDCYDIDYDTTRRYDAEWLADEEAIVFDIETSAS